MKKMKSKKTIFVFKGIVFNKNNEILIDNRCEKELEEADGKWELPGGKIEFGEVFKMKINTENMKWERAPKQYVITEDKIYMFDLTPVTCQRPAWGIHAFAGDSLEDIYAYASNMGEDIYRVN